MQVASGPESERRAVQTGRTPTGRGGRSDMTSNGLPTTQKICELEIEDLLSLQKMGYRNFSRISSVGRLPLSEK
jgi:hypothetical protein